MKRQKNTAQTKEIKNYIHQLRTKLTKAQTPVNDPHAEVEVKSQLKPRGSVLRKITQNFAPD